MSTAEIMKFNPREVQVADLDDGYTRIANEIYEAIIGSSLTQNQSKVAHAIIRLTYGYNKKNDRIADSQIAKITNLPRQKVNKAKNELIDMNIIMREANKIGVNKAVSEWNFSKCHQNNDNVTKTVTKNVTKVVTRVSPKQSHTKDIISKDNKNNNTPSFDEKKKSKEKIDFDLVMDAYNDAVSEKLPEIKKMTTARKNAVKKLLNEFEEPTFQALANYFYDFVDNAKPFYFGENDRHWKADFDYIVRPATYLKVLEGSL